MEIWGNLIVLDNSAAHLRLDSLENIQVEFLSSYTASLVQPVDMGIIKKIEDFISRKVESIQEKSTDIIFNSQGG
jgi:hypothetical protein